jgi:hypothetical protein
MKIGHRRNKFLGGKKRKKKEKRKKERNEERRTKSEKKKRKGKERIPIVRSIDLDRLITSVFGNDVGHCGLPDSRITVQQQNLALSTEAVEIIYYRNIKNEKNEKEETDPETIAQK